MTRQRFIGIAGPSASADPATVTALGMTVAEQGGGRAAIPGLLVIHCSYCWRSHHVPSLAWWIEHNQIGCGKDEARYFFTRADYIAYVRQYKAGWDEANSRPEPDARPMARPVPPSGDLRQLSLFAEGAP